MIILSNSLQPVKEPRAKFRDGPHEGLAHVINSVTSSFEGQETSVAWISSRQRNKTEEPHINAEHLPWLTPKLLLLSGSYLVDCKDAGLGLEDVQKHSARRS